MHSVHLVSFEPVELSAFLKNEKNAFLPARRSASAVFATATCLSVCHSRYCIETDHQTFFSTLYLPPHRFSNTTHDCEILTRRGACHSGGLRYFQLENA